VGSRRVGPADGCVVGTEEATRGDYEDNPPDRSVAKSAHSVRLRSAAGKGKMSRGERCIHSTETDGLQDRHQRGVNAVAAIRVGSRSSAKGRGERTEAEGIERARKNIGSRVRERERERSPRARNPQPGQRQRRDGRRAHRPSPSPFHTVKGSIPPACSPSSNLSSLSNGGALAVNRPRELLKISLSITSPASWPHFPAPPSIGGE
jgi:hypothetical protein